MFRTFGYLANSVKNVIQHSYKMINQYGLNRILMTNFSKDNE